MTIPPPQRPMMPWDAPKHYPQEHRPPMPPPPPVQPTYQNYYPPQQPPASYFAYQQPPVQAPPRQPLIQRPQYMRRQQGHSLTKHILFGWICGYVLTIYYVVSPNHYFHL